MLLFIKLSSIYADVWAYSDDTCSDTVHIYIYIFILLVVKIVPVLSFDPF